MTNTQLALRKEGGLFYVTIRRDSRVGYLLGPYEEHAQAVGNVDLGRRLALAADSFAAFDDFGTAQVIGEIKTVFGPQVSAPAADS